MSAETIWAGLRICYRVVGWSLFCLRDGGAAFPWSIRGVQDCFQNRQDGWSSWSSVFICIIGETKMKCVLYRYQAAKLLDLLLGTAKCNK